MFIERIDESRWIGEFGMKQWCYWSVRQGFTSGTGVATHEAGWNWKTARSAQLLNRCSPRCGSTWSSTLIHWPLRKIQVDRNHDCDEDNPEGEERYNRGALTTTIGSHSGWVCKPSLLDNPFKYNSEGRIGVSVYGKVGTVVCLFLYSCSNPVEISVGCMIDRTSSEYPHKKVYW